MFTLLAERLLLREGSPWNEHGSFGSLSLPARQAYARGERAIQAWDLAGADAAFTAATGRIPVLHKLSAPRPGAVVGWR